MSSTVVEDALRFVFLLILLQMKPMTFRENIRGYLFSMLSAVSEHENGYSGKFVSR